MDKQTKIRKLTWEYFFKQKKEEILDFWSVLKPCLIGISLFTAIIFQGFWSINEKTELPYSKTVGIIGLCIIGFWILMGIIWAIKIFCEWIKSNWKEAKKKARRKVK